MRVLWFSPVILQDDITTGGGWVISLANKLSENSEIELHIAYNDYCDSVEMKTINGINVYAIPKGTKNKYLRAFYRIIGYNDRKEIKSDYLRVIEMIDPDIIQLFGSEHDYGVILENIDIPVVIHIQCIYQVYYHKYYTGISYKDVKKYSPAKYKLTRNTFNHSYKLSNANRVRSELEYYSQCKFYMGRTDWDRRCTRLLSPESKYYHCDEMLRDEFFNHTWSVKQNDAIINIISTIGEATYKGLETIIEAVNLLKNNTKYNIHWRVIGLLDKGQSVHICRRKYKDKFSKSIILLGKMNSSSMIKSMLDSDIYVHPSHIEDGSNAISEAMLLGMPVVCTAVGGVITTIEDGKTGIHVQDGDPWSMAGAIKELHENKSFAEKLGHNARQVAHTRHNPETIYTEVLTIYEDILNNGLS